VKYH